MSARVPRLTLPGRSLVPSTMNASGRPSPPLPVQDVVATADFVDLPDDLTCPVCMNALLAAVETPCGHWFCRQCLLQCLPSCPTCRTEVAPADLPQFDSKSKSRAVRDLEVRCGRRHAGCEWQGALRNLPAHIKECGFVEVACTACGGGVTRAALAVHMESTCHARFVVCPACETSLTAGELESHLQACSAVTVACPNACGKAGITRADLPTHLQDDCSKAMAACPLAIRGCTHRCPREHLPDHLTAAALEHNALLVGALAAMEDKLTEQARHSARLEAALNLLLEKAELPTVRTPKAFTLETTLAGHVSCVFSCARWGRGIMTGSLDTTVRVWQGGSEAKVLSGHSSQVYALAACGDAMLSASGDGTVKVWVVCGDRPPPGDAAPSTGKDLRCLSTHLVQAGAVRALAVTADSVVAVGRHDGAVGLWRLKESGLVPLDRLGGSAGSTSARPPTAVTALAAPHPGIIVAGHQSGALRLWCLEPDKPTSWTFGGKVVAHTDVVYSMTVVGGRLVTGSGEGNVKVWKVSYGGHHRVTLECEATLLGHSAYVSCVAPLGPDAFLSSSKDATVRVWRASPDAGWRCWGTLRLPAPVYTVMGVGDDTVVAGLQTGAVQVWRTSVLQ